MNKKGLSPVIATVLLISIALILAIIIFLWARSFLNEKAMKFEEPVESSCEKLQFDFEASSNTDGTIRLDLVNTGSIALYGFEIMKIGAGKIEYVDDFTQSEPNGLSGSLKPGESASVAGVYVDTSDGTSELSAVPIIIGEVGNTKKSYVCDEKYGVRSSIVS